jgi:ABC-type phosphate transport system permease subunit
MGAQVISILGDSFRAVPRDDNEALLAVETTYWQMLYRILVPAAKSRIMAAIIFG